MIRRMNSTVNAPRIAIISVGGIDLDAALLDLQIKRDGNGVPLPLDQQPAHMQIEGFLPIIINLTPINLPLSLGLKEDGIPLEKAVAPSQRKPFPQKDLSYRFRLGPWA